MATGKRVGIRIRQKYEPMFSVCLKTQKANKTVQGKRRFAFQLREPLFFYNVISFSDTLDCQRWSPSFDASTRWRSCGF